MKTVWTTWGFLAIVAGRAWCQTALPPHSIRGFADFAVAPPHNEIDTGLCDPAKSNPFPNVACGAYARYAWSGYLEMQPLNRGPVRRLFLIFEPKLFAGNNIPQLRYTAAVSPILWEASIGAGFELPRHFELRYSYHKAWLSGSYSGAAVAGLLNPDGPYGRYATVGARWNFGGWGRYTGAIPGIRGFVDVEIAPPHDEVDLGLCASAGSNSNAACAAYARYIWSGYTELRPWRKGPLRRGFLFFEPNVYGGSNVPQQRYTADPALILWEFNAGAAIELPGHFELRFTQHEVHPLGRYGGVGSAATLRSYGPYGNYATLGLRWNFGGWARSR